MLAATIGHAQSNLVLLSSQPGDYIGGGQIYVTTNPASFTAAFSVYGLQVDAFGFIIWFDGPDDLPLAVGNYPDAARDPFNGSSPGLSVFGNGRGCNTLCGSFEVKELDADDSGNLTRLWLTFTQRCECSMPPMTGEIRYNSQLAPAIPTPQTLRVPQDYPTIQSAIDAANILTSDVVVVSNGTYYEHLDFRGKAISVASLNGPQVTIIDGSNSGNVVTFTSGETTNSVLTGFTLTHAEAGVGVASSSPTIISNRMINCGAGVSCSFASPAIVGNYISGSAGTAIFFGGAGTPLLAGNTLVSNHAGGVNMFAAGAPTIINNLIQDNGGDGINMVNQCDADIVQNVIVGNAGNGILAAIPGYDRGPFIINNTILRNADAGINEFGFPSSSKIINNIVVGTPAITVAPWYGLPLATIQFNNFYSPTGSNVYYGDAMGDLTGVDGNISANPFFVCEPGGDYHLLAESLCIDAGTNDAPLLPKFDYDGNLRARKGFATNAATVDLGAFEFNPATSPVPCMFIDCPSDSVVNTAAGQPSVVVNFPHPNATPVATVTCSPPSGAVFYGGTNVVTCTATYGSNSVSCSFIILVVVAPTITQQPQNVTVSAGQNCTLSVSASGTPAFNYQWLFQGNIISGADSATLVVSNVQTANDGVYGVLVSNSAGSTNSHLARIRVLPAKPGIVVQPVSQIVSAGSSARFNVAANGSEPFGYQWFLNQRLIPGANSSQLLLTNVQGNHAGVYSVLVSNLVGRVISQAAPLTVKSAAPDWVIQPASAALRYGSTLTMSSQASGSEPISYQWYFQGRPLRNQTKPQLKLASLTKAAAGQYSVMARNNYGSITSTGALLSVLEPPRISHPLTHQIVTVGQKVVLSFTVQGDGPMTYAWQFNGQPLANTNNTLVITNIVMESSGYFQVTAMNSYGSISSVARVSVSGPPTRLIAWGDNSGGQTTIPADVIKVVDVVGGDFHTLAIRANRTLAAWGSNASGQRKIPPHLPPIAYVAAGARHNLALGVNGTIFAWGDNAAGQCTIPATATNQPLTVTAGDAHSVTLLADGTVLAWGDNTYGQTSLPYELIPGSYVWWWWQPFPFYWPNPNWQPTSMVSAGRNHNLAILTTGSVIAWGDNSSGQCNVPTDLTNATEVVGGYLHSVALRADGTVSAWGDDSYGQTDVPPGLTNVVAIAAGDFHNLALLANGKLVSWGDDLDGQIDIPASVINALGIATGYYHSLALVPLIK